MHHLPIRLARLLIACTCFSLWLAPGRAQAQSAADRTTARALAQEGQEAYDQGDYATAEDRFARAEGLVHAPTLLLGLARAQVKLGRLVQAYENYQRVLREEIPASAPEVWRDAQRKAKDESDLLLPRLAWVTIEVRGASDPRVTLEDGTLVPKPALGVKRAVNPGAHQITASAIGYRTETADFYIREGQSIAVSLSLEVDPQAAAAAGPAGLSGVTWAAAANTKGGPEPAPSRGWVYASFGLGAVGLAVGTVAGTLAMSRHAALERDCPGGQCPASARGSLDSYRAMGKASTIGFIVGGLGVAAGTALLLSEPKPSAGADTQSFGLELELGPGHVAFRRSF